jgi:hypothetical protein
MRLSTLVSTLACAASLALQPSPTSAAPISFEFSGSVAGSTGSYTDVLADFPIGTPASFTLTFDAGPLTPTVPTTWDLGPASGRLALGAGEWLLDHGAINQYSYLLSTGAVLWYGLQFTGSGPLLTNDGELFGLFLRLTPDLELATPGWSVAAGFGYTTGSGGFTVTRYSYADLSGELTREPVETPEPGSLSLVALGVTGLALIRRRSTADRRPRT